ncbi:MAG TPA: M23 family metallopeptidase [Stellaceae bacterium]|nr:M23 family metallopeptidase [Stellaceae bacterium]
MKPFASALGAVVRPISLCIVLVAGLHLAIGALALRAFLHPATPHIAAATPAKPATTTKPTPAVAQAAPTREAVEAEPLRSHATLLDPMLLARENAGLAQLRAAGVNLETLFHHATQVHRAADEGGPFIPLGGIRDAALDPSRLARLERLIARMPFAAPLLHYTVSSPFGVRHDPFDGERAFHPGVDLEAETGDAVFSTAPGVVDFAGFDGAYGRMIEIDHDNGIRTRYAHLSRLLVRVGDRVDEHQRIGLVGSSGRSTGPHLHYEVRIDGQPLNPAKFLAVGRQSPLIAIDAAQ